MMFCGTGHDPRPVVLENPPSPEPRSILEGLANDIFAARAQRTPPQGVVVRVLIMKASAQDASLLRRSAKVTHACSLELTREYSQGGERGYHVSSRTASPRDQSRGTRGGLSPVRVSARVPQAQKRSTAVYSRLTDLPLRVQTPDENQTSP
jgi:hypothetical protein